MFENNFSRWHAEVFLAPWLVFAALTLCIVLTGLDIAAQHPLTVIATVVGSVLGPLSGAISRGFQSCCRAFSLSLLPFCLTTLTIASLAQLIRLPDIAWLRRIRLAVWVAGLVVWFGGGIVSFGHALG